MNKRFKIKCIFLALLGIMCSVQACEPKRAVDAEGKWLSISDSIQKMIVLDYVNALDSFGLTMPIVGRDIESIWAADTIHVMAQRLKMEQGPFLESMIDIYQMQNYIAYGMSYRNAIVAFPCDTTTLCSYVLQDMLASSDSLYQAIIAERYKSMNTWNVIRFKSILNMQLFYTLNGMNSQPPYRDKDLNCSALCLKTLDNIKSKGQLTDKEMFQASCFLESIAFFKMIVPLITLMDDHKIFVKRNEDFITEAAHYFDAKANPVFSLVHDGKEMQFLSDKEFEEYLLKATRYKTGLLRIVTQEMLAMEARGE